MASFTQWVAGLTIAGVAAVAAVPAIAASSFATFVGTFISTLGKGAWAFGEAAVNLGGMAIGGSSAVGGGGAIGGGASSLPSLASGAPAAPPVTGVEPTVTAPSAPEVVGPNHIPMLDPPADILNNLSGNFSDVSSPALGNIEPLNTALDASVAADDYAYELAA